MSGRGGGTVERWSGGVNRPKTEDRGNRATSPNEGNQRWRPSLYDRKTQRRNDKKTEKEIEGMTKRQDVRKKDW